MFPTQNPLYVKQKHRNMQPQLGTTMSMFLISIAIIFFSAPTVSAQDDYRYGNCSASFQCGNLTDIGYPFYGGDRPSYCGYPGFELTNCSSQAPVINITGLTYQVLEIFNETRTVKVARTDYVQNVCPTSFRNTTTNNTLFDFSADSANITIYYGCPQTINLGFQAQFSCNTDQTGTANYYLTPSMATTATTAGVISLLNPCSNKVYVPAYESNIGTLNSNLSEENFVSTLDQGFGLGWKAENNLCETCGMSGGLCGYNDTNASFVCLCQNRTEQFVCASLTGQSGTGGSSKTSLGIGLGVAGAAVFGIGLGAWILLVVQRRKRKAAVAVLGNGKDEPTPHISSKVSKSITTPSANFSQTTSSFQSSKSTDIEKGSTYFGVQLFSYSELEQATDKFDSSKELGDGGFGTVYYGVLQDGRVVAVKRLFENNMRRAEQFMNEIEILARLRHPNLVTLYGCTSRRSRELLLVYEYIPNGTVADHLNGKLSETGVLTWPIRLSIAIETAEALAFLHAKEVIHRDVKTNNILLDNDFCVKVADFGLSRLFPNDVTHVSTAPQGTPGYVDPEYYQCYQLTDKSDVYSFGVVLIELISSLPAVDTNRHRQDINLANMAVNKIQNHALRELVDPSLGFETDYAVRRMATSVAELAFRCLQQERDMRPTMGEVLEALKKIENENYGAEKVEIVDIRDDDVGLLRNLPPPLSPDSSTTAPIDKWDKMVKTF